MNPARKALVRLGLSLILFALSFSISVSAQDASPKAPPKTRIEPVVDMLHGVEVPDPYRWLEDQNVPETRAWIDAQNSYTRSVLDPLPMREKLRRRFGELLRVTIIGTPVAREEKYFFFKRNPDQNQGVIYVRRGVTGKDEVLLDPNPMSPDHSISVSLYDVSRDGSVVAYGLRQGGEDEVRVQLLDVSTRKNLADQLPRGRYFGISMKPDKSGFYYARHTTQGTRIYYHDLGSDPTKDAEIFGKGYGAEKIIAVELSEDGRYLFIWVHHGSAAKKVEVYLQDLERGTALQTLVNDIDANFSGTAAGDFLFLETNWKAPNSRVLRVNLKDPAKDKWREIIPESDVPLSGIYGIGGRLFAHYLRSVSSQLKSFDTEGKALGEITLPAIGSLAGLSGNWDRKEMFYSFTSFTFPRTIYRYDAATGKQSVWARNELPVNSERFEVKQVWYPSKDGTKIPMFIVHAKGLKLDGSNPTLLTGYGGFNASLTPNFSATVALWVENGGVFAQPNLRGGGEFGEKWHQAGMLDKKQNVFDDFIAAAEWLIANKYTTSSKLAISGGSNGGLLVGAAMTQRPELFRAVVCTYPLLDMVRYHKFLVAGFWVPEYGSADNPDQFKYLHAYSPYHQVKQGTGYPAVLFVTGDSDTRVAPLHARKMTALVQAATSSDKPVILVYDTKAGHSGGTPVNKQIEDQSDIYSFLFWQLKMGTVTKFPNFNPGRLRFILD